MRKKIPFRSLRQTTSDHRALLKDIELVPSDNSTFVIVCKRANIKLDRLTTYVFANIDLSPTK